VRIASPSTNNAIDIGASAVSRRSERYDRRRLDVVDRSWVSTSKPELDNVCEVPSGERRGHVLDAADAGLPHLRPLVICVSSSLGRTPDRHRDGDQWYVRRLHARHGASKSSAGQARERA